VTIVTKPRYSIRAAELGDSAEIARLAEELGYPATPTDISARLESLLGQPNHFIAVAATEEGQKLLGWIAAEERTLLVASPQIEVMGLVVDGTVRREGVGHALIGAIEHWATERGQGNIVIRSNVRRQESHPFYEGLGYRCKKSQHVYVKEASGDAGSAGAA
jgi:GNAT superfamily N-acetyltransferase